MQFITCAIGEHRLAVDVRQVREIIRLPRLTPVPTGPAHIAGLINLRGRVLTIFHMARCLGGCDGRPAELPHVLIMRGSDELPSGMSATVYEQVGLLVDAIGEIVAVDASTLGPPPANLPLGKAPFVPAVVELGGRLHGVLGVEPLYVWANSEEEEAGAAAS